MYSFFYRIDVEGLLAVESLQPGSTDNLHLVDFQDVDVEEPMSGAWTQAFVAVFTRKPQNDVCARHDASFVGSTDGTSGASEVVASVDAPQRFVVGRLHAILHDEEGLAAELLQIVEQSVVTQSGRVPMTSPTTSSSANASSYMLRSFSNVA